MEQQSSKRFFAHHQLQPSALHHHSTQHWLSDCPNEPSTPSLLIAVPPTSNVISSTPCETLCRSGSSMSHVHERDYISLAEISSSASIDQAEKVDVVDLHHEDTDLRLGLGPPTKVRESDSPCLESGLPCKGPPQTCVQIKDAMGTASISSHDAQIYLLSSAMRSKRLEVIPIPTMGALAGSIAAMSSQRSLENTSGLNVCKYGTKRLFSDTISQVPSVGSCIDLHGTPGDTMLGGRSTSRSMVQAEGQPQYKHQQRVYWAAPQAWHTDSLSQVACRMPLMPNNSTSLNPLVSSQEHTNDSNALKGQVVGWPPVRSHRRNALATQSRPAGGFLQSAIYVKVNMDGIPIGRKVDLNAYTSYEELVNALEGMFQNPHTGARFLHAGEFALTYEDKEGDWMLVGDVPWGFPMVRSGCLQTLSGVSALPVHLTLPVLGQVHHKI